MGERKSGWCVYLLSCADGTLYCGCTDDLERRVKTHNDGKGAKYTRCRTPVFAVYQGICADRSAALKEEAHIKKFSRAQKLVLIDQGSE
jgi:putative endonuclease